MSGTAQPAAYGSAGYAPPGWGPPSGGRGFDPWGFVWAMPRPLLIAVLVLGFIAFWPIGLAILFFMIGSGRIGGRWARRHGMGRAEMQGGCGWRGRKREEAPSSGNRAFDEYRQDTLRRLEEEQQDFAAFLERLRFAKDKSEFDQFMAERRSRPPAPPAGEPQAQG